MTSTENTTLVRVRSNRAMHKLLALSPNPQWWFSFEDGNNIAEIPNDKLDDALAIKGITRARPKTKLMKCWGSDA